MVNHARQHEHTTSLPLLRGTPETDGGPWHPCHHRHLHAVSEVGLMARLTCHDCGYVFEDGHGPSTQVKLRQHRKTCNPDKWVNGRPFWSLEIKVSKADYYWIARQIRDKQWLEAHAGGTDE
jgi:hypothetical protein